jgi:hypothetical protein
MKMFTFGIEREKKAYINVYLYHLVNQERSNLFVIWSILARLDKNDRRRKNISHLFTKLQISSSIPGKTSLKMFEDIVIVWDDQGRPRSKLLSITPK